MLRNVQYDILLLLRVFNLYDTEIALLHLA